MKKILLVLIGVSALLFGEFSRSGDIVSDSKTGLMWQDDVDAKTVKKTWEEAINYCEALTLGGYDGWRLPNIRELKSIVDDTRNNPAIDSVFVNIVSGDYWSSTTLSGFSVDAWGVDFDYGFDGLAYKSNSSYVRCVRAVK